MIPLSDSCSPQKLTSIVTQKTKSGCFFAKVSYGPFALQAVIHLETVTFVICRKQCPNRAPVTNETDTPPVKRRGSSFLEADSSKIAANSP
jgi:hypothetical protein